MRSGSGQQVRFRPDGSKEEASRQGRLGQHRGRREDAHGQGPGRPGQRRRAGCGPTPSAPGGSSSARRRQAVVVPERGRPVGGRLPRRLRPRQGLPDATDAPRSSTPARCGSGAKDGTHTEIIAGVLPGELVVDARAAAPCGPNCSRTTWARAEGAASSGPVGPPDCNESFTRPRRESVVLNWIIDFSLRHRFLVILGVAGPGRRRRAVACATSTSTPSPTRRRCRCRSTPSPRRSARRRSSSRSPSPSSRPSAACRGCEQLRSRLEVRPVAGRRHLRGRHRHLLRPPAGQRAARRRSSCPRASTGRSWGRSPPASARSSTTSSPARATTLTELRTLHDWVIRPQLRTRPGHGRDQLAGAATRSSTRSASTPTGSSSTA